MSRRRLKKSYTNGNPNQRHNADRRGTRGRYKPPGARGARGRKFGAYKPPMCRWYVASRWF